ncbi:MAG: hypothetical protein JWN95_396 [Frankiales bacterium]|nr:hypothetical protein [Frankiales bacterium]
MTNSSADKKWIGAGIVGGLVILALAWFLAIGPERSRTAEMHAQAADLQTSNLSLQARTNKLRSDNANAAKLVAELAAARAELPSDSGLPEFTRQLSAQATTAGVALTSISAGAPTALASTAAISGKTAASASSSGNLFSLAVTVASQGSAASQQKFLNALQVAGPRRALVNSVDYAPASSKSGQSDSTSSTMTVNIDVFVSPQSPAANDALQRDAAKAGVK